MPIYAKWTKPGLALLCLAALLIAVPLTLAGPPAQGGGPVVVVDTSALNQRTGPGPEYAIQGSHPGGTILPVIGRTSDRSWWQVVSDYGTGWVSNEFVVTRNSFRDVPIVSEFGMLEEPRAIIIGQPMEGYAVPNPGGQVLGLALTDSSFPIVARSYFSGTETWYWLVETTSGQAWLPETEGLALYGYVDRVRVYSRDQAFALPRSAPSADGRLVPPPAPPVLDAPVAPQVIPTLTATVAAPTVAPVTVEAAPPTAVPTSVPPAPVERFGMVLGGDCSPLALVNYLVQRSPARATGLICSNNAQGANAVGVGVADLSMAVDAGCGGVVTVPVATLYSGSTTHTLNFCISGTPNTSTRTFVDWVRGASGAAAIRSYRGLAGTTAPERAEPLG